MRRTTHSERAVVLAPLGRDATVAVGMLGEAGIEAVACGSLPELVGTLDTGAAFVVVTEEALASADMGPLSGWLGTQQEWSDLPFVLLTNRGGGLERNPAARRFLDVLGNVTFLERPFHPTTLVSLARSALRGRRRQYEARARLEELRAGEARYRTLFEAIEVGFCIVEMRFDDAMRPIDYRLAEVNPAFERQTGLHGAAGRWVSEAVPGLERHWFETYGRVALTGESVRFENFAAPFGRWYDVYAFRTGEAQERRVGILFNDVTHAKRAEAALRESEQRFRNMADHAPVMMWVTDPTGTCTYLNARWYEFTGQTPQEAMGFGWLDVTHPDDKDEAGRVFLAANAAHRPFRLEYRLRRHDGSYRWAIDAASPRFGAEGEFLGYIGSVTDIHERREIEDALRTSEDRLRLANEAAAIGTWDFDPVTGTLRWDERCKALFGVGPDAPVDYDTFLARLHPDDRAASDAAVQQALMPDGAADFAVEYRTIGIEDGVERWIASRGQAFFEGVGEARRARRFVGTVIDVTAAKRAEEVLERRVAEALAEKKLLADIVEGTDALVQVVDLDFRWMAINRASADAFEQIFGVRPKAGESMLDILADQPEHREAVRAVWARALAGEEFTEIGEFGDPGRARRFYEMKYNVLRDARGERIGAYQFVYDVTQRVAEQRRLSEAEEALRQAQKMEAVGQLTGGVAHDFNNLLTIIKSSTDLLRRPGLVEERRRRYVDAISDTVDRASKLTGQLLAFARRQALKPEVFDASVRVATIAEMLRTLVGSRVQIAADLAAGRSLVEADASQFETALVNIVVNARDAMDGEGRLTVRVAAESAKPPIRGHAGSAGPFVAVSITDTGSGIAPDRLPHILEPFYTTKAVGKGTGLGLSQVYGFAKQSGGDVAVESTPGEGTTFTLYLPQVAAVAAHQGVAPEARGHGATVDGRGRRVLVVEDNVEVGTFSTQLLQDLGYETAWAANADEALSLLARANGFDVVFTDVIMPGMSGVELGQEIRRRFPDLPVVLTSGYSHVLAEEGRHGFELLKKPYAVEDLSRVLRRAMRRQASH